eukprot:1427546-Karenia_brevis.AAC.1
MALREELSTAHKETLTSQRQLVDVRYKLKESELQLQVEMMETQAARGDEAIANQMLAVESGEISAMITALEAAQSQE